MDVKQPTKEKQREVVPVRKGDLKKVMKKGNRIAIDGHVFRVINIDYFSGSVVLKHLPKEEVFFKMPETKPEAKSETEISILTKEESNVDSKEKEI